MIQEVVMLPSGVKLSMQPAPWIVVGDLNCVIATELKAVGLDFSSPFVQAFIAAALSGDRAQLLAAIGGTDINTLKNLGLQLIASKPLRAIVYDCMLCCTYNGVKISPDIFEPEDARADYYPIVWEVLKLNLRPFFKSLISTSSSPTPLKAEARG